MSMTADQVIQKSFLHAQRKATAPNQGTPKYLALLGIVDSMQKLWASESDVDWDSLYDLRTLAAPAPLSDSVALDADIDYLIKQERNPVRIGDRTFKVVNPSQLYTYRESDVCAQIGSTLRFSRTLDSALTGLSIQVPAILRVNDITVGTDIVQVDDPMWLVYSSAAEFNRNDLVKVSQYDNLLQLADMVMQKMKQKNVGSMEEVDMPWQPAGESWI